MSAGGLREKMRSLLCFVALKAHCEQPRLGVLAKDKAVVAIAQYGGSCKNIDARTAAFTFVHQHREYDDAPWNAPTTVTSRRSSASAKY
jgi:hypothetical protein